jgi:hypothetical protein
VLCLCVRDTWPCLLTKTHSNRNVSHLHSNVGCVLCLCVRDTWPRLHTKSHSDRNVSHLHSNVGCVLCLCVRNTWPCLLTKSHSNQVLYAPHHSQSLMLHVYAACDIPRMRSFFGNDGQLLVKAIEREQTLFVSGCRCHTICRSNQDTKMLIRTTKAKPISCKSCRTVGGTATGAQRRSAAPRS